MLISGIFFMYQLKELCLLVLLRLFNSGTEGEILRIPPYLTISYYLKYIGYVRCGVWSVKLFA